MKRSAALLGGGGPATPAKRLGRPSRARGGGAGGGGEEAAAATPSPSNPRSLQPAPLAWTPASLTAAADRLAALHPTLRDLHARHGVPTARLLPVPPHHHFGTLARALVGQQVSGAAAATIHARALAAAGLGSGGGGGGGALLTPAAVAATPLEALRAAGLSGRKASYVTALAAAFTPPAGSLAGVDLRTLDDASLVAALTAIPGIGPWSAHMFCMFGLGRPDVLPTGDLGIKKGVALLFGLRGGALPGPSEMEGLMRAFEPHRSLACWWLWRLVGESESAKGGEGKKKGVRD